MTGVALLLLAASLGHALSRALKLPPMPFLVLGGFALSAGGFVRGDFLQDALVLGVAFLVFVAGIELDPTRVGEQGRAALLVGTLQFLLLGAVGLGASLALGFDTLQAFYLALGLTASSTLVAVRVLQRRRQLFEPYGRLVIGVLLLQDLLVIVLTPVLTRLPGGAGAVAAGVAGTLGLTGLAWIMLRFVLPRLLRKMALDEELLLLVVLSILFAFLFMADGLGLPLVAGAFFAGVSLSSFPVNGVVRGQLTSISDFFTAIFFTALGATLAIPSLEELGRALVLGGVVVLLTPVLVAVVAERTGFSARPAILSGLLLSQTSEFSLVVGLQGMALGQLAPEAFQVLVLVTLVTMTLTPALVSDRVTLALLHLHPSRLRNRRSDIAPPRDHVLLFGCGTSGMPLLETLIIGPYPVVAVDDDPRVVEQVRNAGVEAFRGDATDPAVLDVTGAGSARVIVSTVRRTEDNGPLLRGAGMVPVVVRVFGDDDAAWIRARGGRPVLYADAAAGEFLEWFDRRGWETPDDLAEAEMEDVL